MGSHDLILCVLTHVLPLQGRLLRRLRPGLLLRRLLGHVPRELRQRPPGFTEVLGPRGPRLLLRAFVLTHPDPPRRQLLLDDLLLHRAEQEVGGGSWVKLSKS